MENLIEPFRKLLQTSVIVSEPLAELSWLGDAIASPLAQDRLLRLTGITVNRVARSGCYRKSDPWIHGFGIKSRRHDDRLKRT